MVPYNTNTEQLPTLGDKTKLMSKELGGKYNEIKVVKFKFKRSKGDGGGNIIK